MQHTGLPMPSDAEITSLWHRTAIAEVIYGYALNIREGRGAACADLFTEDAVYDMYGTDPATLLPHLRTRLEGREAIIAHISGASGHGSRVCPMIHNLSIRIEGREAIATSTMSAVVFPGGTDLVGGYTDRLRYEGGWRFCARVHTIYLQRSPAPHENQHATGENAR